MSDGFVVYDRRGPVVVIRLNRPDRMNSLSHALVAELDLAWRRFVEDEEARVAIYTGTGRAFCAGMDIKEAAQPSRVRSFPEPPLTIFHAGAVTKPVVAAVNGYAVGGGCFDVMRCDLRIAAASATFQLAEVTRSVLPHPLIEGIAGALPDCVVTELGLGRRLTARRAYEIGLVNEVVEANELLQVAQETASEIAGLPPLAVKAVLEGLRKARQAARSSTALHEWQRRATRELAASQDYREALAAFIEKRDPVYEGR